MRFKYFRNTQFWLADLGSIKENFKIGIIEISVKRAFQWYMTYACYPWKKNHPLVRQGVSRTSFLNQKYICIKTFFKFLALSKSFISFVFIYSKIWRPNLSYYIYFLIWKKSLNNQRIQLLNFVATYNIHKIRVRGCEILPIPSKLMISHLVYSIFATIIMI